MPVINITHHIEATHGMFNIKKTSGEKHLFKLLLSENSEERNPLNN